MPWEKTPPEIIAAFDAAAPKNPDVEHRPMFGYRALFLGGNMFAGTFRDQVVVRLGESDRIKLKGAVPFAPMPGRPMRDYVVVPAATVKRTGELAKWIDLAHAHARSLPTKKKAAKPARAKPAAAKGAAKKKAATKPKVTRRK